jgi:protein-S-isoprenylcysteine O-methyltransferase
LIDNLVVFRRMTGKAENRDRSSLAVILALGGLVWWVGIALSYAAFGAVSWPIVQVVGLVMMAIGIAIRSLAIIQLGRFHTPNVAIRTDHQLLDTGLYRYVRHPSYFGAIVAFTGLALALDNWLSLALIAIATPCIYLYRMREEEAALAAAFGDAYRDYCARTKRLIPWLY